jgi:hypothetical protein
MWHSCSKFQLDPIRISKSIAIQTYTVLVAPPCILGEIMLWDTTRGCDAIVQIWIRGYPRRRRSHSESSFSAKISPFQQSSEFLNKGWYFEKQLEFMQLLAGIQKFISRTRVLSCWTWEFPSTVKRILIIFQYVIAEIILYSTPAGLSSCSHLTIALKPEIVFVQYYLRYYATNFFNFFFQIIL